MMTPVITTLPAAGPIRRCTSCGVLDRAGRHVCNAADVERFARECEAGALSAASVRFGRDL